MSIFPTLKPGQTIGVFAPSSYVEKVDIEASKALLEKRGYNVYIHPQTYARHGQMAGTDGEKIKAISALWERDDIHALWAAGGGNRALNLLNKLDLTRAKAAPKALIGFSDTTALLNAVYAHTGLITFHGPVFKSLHSYDPKYIDHCLMLLEGKIKQIQLDGAKTLRDGEAEGPLIGGCLSLFQYLVGTNDCPDLDGAILFLEDTGDHLSRFDRMFTHLQRMGVFESISGLILGEFHDVQEGARPFGFSLEEIALEYTNNSGFPVLFNAPLGHDKTLLTFPIGQVAKLSTSDILMQFIGV